MAGECTWGVTELVFKIGAFARGIIP